MVNKEGCATDMNDKKGKDEVVDDRKIPDDFVAPDGGWGWMIVLAAGFANFCMFPVLQAFGLIFRDRFIQLGITSSETTTILNINVAVMSCIGLANGPLFRKYTYRQVSLVGALVAAISVTMLSAMETFTGILIFFSILYAAGMGIAMSSNALALNTYFKKKRRIATGFSWTCTGMGPIVMPQVITLLMPVFGMQGTVLIYGGLAFNAVACALLLQPVSWHTKSTNMTEMRDLAEEKLLPKTAENCAKSQSVENVAENGKIRSSSLSQSKQKFGSQYLYYDDDEEGAAGIDILGPETSMISRANDGWFSKKNTSNASLASRSSKKALSRRQSMNLSRHSSLTGLSRGPSTKTLNRQTSDAENRCRKISNTQLAATPLNIVNESSEHAEPKNCNGHHLTEAEGVKEETNDTMREVSVIRETAVEDNEPSRNIRDEFQDYIEEPWYKKVVQAVVVFFDLDLLRDPIYVNLMLGVTFANFSEMNFSLMTPFILSENGFTKQQVATTMSILGGVDVGTRLAIPFVATAIGWGNRTFFLAGICAIATGRVVMAHVATYEVNLAVAVLIGIGKALRTIFMALVIPSHVPLSRLPAATGLQLLSSGIMCMAMGPLVGWIRDTTGDFAIMLHFLNIFTYATTLSWAIEICFRNRKARKRKAVEKEKQQNAA